MSRLSMISFILEKAGINFNQILLIEYFIVLCNRCFRKLNEVKIYDVYVVKALWNRYTCTNCIYLTLCIPNVYSNKNY